MLFLVGLIILSGIFSASETALTSFRSTNLEDVEMKHPKEGILLRKWLKSPNSILTGMLLGNNIVNILGSSIATAVTFRIVGNNGKAIFISTALMTIVILIFGEITPKIIAKNNAVTISRKVIVPIYYLSFLTKPIIYILMNISKVLSRLMGITISDETILITEKDILSFVNVGEAEGIIEEGEKDMIHSIFEFGETSAKEVMTPRTSMFALEASKTIDQIWTELLEQGFSRVPVYEDTIDNVVGILYVRDILNAVKEGKTDVSIKKFLRIPYFVPENKSIIEILKEFQTKKVHIAMVLDEYGGVVGLVTIEDLIEEIVGEIRDEFDHEEEESIVKVDENTYVIDAMVDIETLNKDLNLDFPISGDYESLAGLILTEIGKVAEIGDGVEIQGVKLKVLEKDKLRISKVLLEIKIEEN
ncbi:MAG: hemolysin family protein [Fusobacteriaceae bacterium]